MQDFDSEIKKHNEKVSNIYNLVQSKIKDQSEFVVLHSALDFPELKASGKAAMNTYRNLKFLLDKLKIEVRWNEMKFFREIIIPGVDLYQGDIENNALREITYLAEINHFHTTRIDEHLNSIAQQNRFHPFADCILSKPWDKTERLQIFINTLETTNNSLTFTLVKRWMLSVVAAIFSKAGFAAQGVLVLQGPQGIGKTRWVKQLDPCDCGAVKEGMIFNPADKDNVRTCSSYTIIELGELEGTFRKSLIAQLKSFLTTGIDVLRMPFAKKDSYIPRRSVYCATVNEPLFLQDDTGNRRWWTLQVSKIDLNHGLDMQQLWAEIFFYYQNGDQTWLSEDEMGLLSSMNTEHEQIEPMEEKLIHHFNWTKDWQSYNTQTMTCTQVLELLGYLCPNTSQTRKMSNILKKHTGKKPKRRIHILPRFKTAMDANEACTVKE